MELMLNLVWAATGLAMLVTWLRMPSHEYATRTGQALCLGVAILLLLPVISLSDDLVAAQMTTETDCCVRRAHEWHAHPTHLCTSTGTEAASEIFQFRTPLCNASLATVASDEWHDAGFIRPPYSRPPPAA